MHHRRVGVGVPPGGDILLWYAGESSTGPLPTAYDHERLVGALTRLERTTIPVLAGKTPGVRAIHNSLWGPPRYSPTDHTEERELLQCLLIQVPDAAGEYNCLSDDSEESDPRLKVSTQRNRSSWLSTWVVFVLVFVLVRGLNPHTNWSPCQHYYHRAIRIQTSTSIFKVILGPHWVNLEENSKYCKISW